jgi:hypothetical protein
VARSGRVGSPEDIRATLIARLDNVPGMTGDFVPADFEVPLRLAFDGVVLVPLGAEHNERDYEAWTSSMDHILATPGFAGWGWPHPMPLEANLADLVRHAEDFAARKGFTYTVLDASDPDDPEPEVVGCLYIYPPKKDDPATAGADCRVRSWVRESRADLDVPLWQAVSTWLAEAWPFESVAYNPRVPDQPS